MPDSAARVRRVSRPRGPTGICGRPCRASEPPAGRTLAHQDAWRSYESRFVHANGVRLQYMDFGGSGPALIFVQDLHNFFEDYFAESELQDRDEWVAFYGQFTDQARVIATVRRGYGESDDPGWGHDVATQSEDLLGLMDALGIEEAVFFGRTAALQDMTWIAEHHPERVAGLVYFGNPFSGVIPPGARQQAGERAWSDALRQTELYSRASCDPGSEADALLKPRSSWTPHFLIEAEARIAIQALRFWAPALRMSLGSRQRSARTWKR